MNLHTFIRENMDTILSEWDSFAHTILPDAMLSDDALRDHAAEILSAIALDMESRQSKSEQIDKSQGLVDDRLLHETAASVHGALRHQSHFSLPQLSAEFRALRASVLRLWLPRIDALSAESVDSMIRFNEAIDQALAESITAYSASADEARELFVGILGHDLRAPLASMKLASAILQRPQLDFAAVPQMGIRLERSVRTMTGLIDDLLGYTQVKTGVGIPVFREDVDLSEACESAMDDAAALHPRACFKLSIEGSLQGAFDNVRIIQLLTNLLKNAAQYGEGGEISLTAVGDTERVTVRVHNHGAAISAESLSDIFQPLVRLNSDTPHRTSLGLGLYVAQQTAIAHAGTITVDSSAGAGTTFSVILPKR